VGIPRNLTFFDFFPFWRAYLEALGCDVVLSRPTNPEIVKATQERAAAESCFPVKLAWGHLSDVVDMGVDMLFLPSLMTRENAAPGQPHNHYCPLISATPHLLMSNMPVDAAHVRVVNLSLHLANSRAGQNELVELARQLVGARRSEARKAIAAGWTALSAFTAAMRARGKEALDALRPGVPAAVVVGRPYTTNDLGACLDLPYKLRRMGVLPIPMDFLPLESAQLPAIHDDMYWRSGQDILRSALVVRDDPRLQAVYLTNFNCGPDAFLITFFRELMEGKPFLQLEVDDHTADAGMVTRCEAFFDSLNLRWVA
jgi:predicted nucleotide-binding protein (sugar kinase/HSP70/actin superfamily)